jgi:hypothetical protein
MRCVLAGRCRRTRRRWSAVNDQIMVGAATSSVLSQRTGVVVVVERLCAPPVSTVNGTGLPFGMREGGPSVPTFERTRPPFAGAGTPVGALGIDGVMGADQVQATALIPAAADQGDPPRRTPSRC